MPGQLLTTASTIMCPHGGQVVLFTSNTKAFAGGTPVLMETDIHPVVGCPFTIGPKYSPCIRIEWSGGASKSGVFGTPELVKSSIGSCYNAENALQGLAIIVNTQIKVSAQ